MSPLIPAAGFLSSLADVSAIATNFDKLKVVQLGQDNDRDRNARTFRQGAYFGDLELVFDIASGAPTQIDGYLTWDANGDNLCAGLFQSPSTEWVSGLTDTSLRMVQIQLRSTRVAPAGEVGNILYLFLKVDTGTIDVGSDCRLQWSALPVWS